MQSYQFTQFRLVASLVTTIYLQSLALGPFGSDYGRIARASAGIDRRYLRLYLQVAYFHMSE